jgi:hypothetical protein
LSARRKSVLIVSYCFPPMPGAGALRPGRLAKLLPEHGWTPTTVTGPWRDAAAEFGDVISVSRLGDPIAPRIRGMYRLAPPPSRWFPGALRATLSLVDRRRFDAVVSISYPGAVHIIASIAAKRAGIPWLADYSEAWNGNRFAMRSVIGVRLNRLLERRCLEGATAITCATPGIRGVLSKLHGRSDIDVIQNAVDFSEWQHVPNHPPAEFSILFAGNLVSGVLTPEPLFAAAAKLRRAGHPAGAAARFEFYSGDHRLVLAAAKRWHVEDALRLHPETLRERVLVAERRAAVLLLLFPMSYISLVPSKFYEYYGARRPILAIGSPESRTQFGDLIEGNHLGLFATTEDECAAAICALYERFTSGRYETQPGDGWSPPTADVAAQRFADILDRISGRSGSADRQRFAVEERV